MGLKGSKQSPEHIAKRIAALRASYATKGQNWTPGRPIENTIENVWRKVLKRGENECWPWKSGTNRGYGRYTVGGYKQVYAHRVAYLSAFPGSITLDKSDERCVLHACDNPGCCNPKHLFIGTHADNMQDKAAKGRAPGFNGEKHKRAKLTNEEAREIRWMHGPSATKKALALLYDVSVSTIKDILSHTTYKEM